MSGVAKGFTRRRENLVGAAPGVASNTEFLCRRQAAAGQGSGSAVSFVQAEDSLASPDSDHPNTMLVVPIDDPERGLDQLAQEWRVELGHDAAGFGDEAGSLGDHP